MPPEVNDQSNTVTETEAVEPVVQTEQVPTKPLPEPVQAAQVPAEPVPEPVEPAPEAPAVEGVDSAPVPATAPAAIPAEPPRRAPQVSEQSSVHGEALTTGQDPQSPQASEPVPEPVIGSSTPVEPISPPQLEPIPEPPPVVEQSSLQGMATASVAAPAPVVQPQNRVLELLAKARSVFQSRKRKKLDRVMTVLSAKNSINNNEVSKLLRVSDATATRYLSQLKKEGRIRQVGKGRGVRYESNK